MSLKLGFKIADLSVLHQTGNLPLVFLALSSKLPGIDSRVMEGLYQ